MLCLHIILAWSHLPSNVLHAQIDVDANLLGGLWTSDNVKHGMPLAYTLTVLSWSLLTYPSAFSGREGQVLNTLR